MSRMWSIEKIRLRTNEICAVLAARTKRFILSVLRTDRNRGIMSNGLTTTTTTGTATSNTVTGNFGTYYGPVPTTTNTNGQWWNGISIPTYTYPNTVTTYPNTVTTHPMYSTFIGCFPRGKRS